MSLLLFLLSLLRTGHSFSLDNEAYWTKYVAQVRDSSLRWDCHFRSLLIWTALLPSRLFRDISCIRYLLTFLNSLQECLQNSNSLGNSRQMGSPTMFNKCLRVIPLVGKNLRSLKVQRYSEILCSSIFPSPGNTAEATLREWASGTLCKCWWGQKQHSEGPNSQLCIDLDNSLFCIFSLFFECVFIFYTKEDILSNKQVDI